MTISARGRLMGQARTFFESELRGLFNWDAVGHQQAEPSEPLPPSRGHPRGCRNPLGKYSEIVAVTFGDFELELQSPEEAPPLGLVTLTHRNAVAHEGPLDQSTWARMGSFIRENCHGG